MSKISFVFTKEMAENLKKIREKAGLYQKEVARRIGFSAKSGKGYISHLEKGMVKNPPIGTILLYLRACGVSWQEFFQELDRIDFKMRHEKMISQLPPPATQRKIQRDTMRYEIGVEFPAKEKPKQDIDFNRLKSRIENKVTPFLIKNDIEGNQASLYQKFTREYFNLFATLNKSGMKAVTDKYLRAGLKFNIISGLRKIIVNEIKAEIKRIEAKKPLPSEKQEKMAIGFTKYRIRIEKIEAEVHKLLCNLGVSSALGGFALYKAFSRECYRILKKYYGPNQELLNKKLNEIIERWKKEGLKDDVLLKIKDKIISVFGTMRLRGEI
jgi:transcriptional regulator with XRE-family HTH domain